LSGYGNAGEITGQHRDYFDKAAEIVSVRQNNARREIV
jgi:hypothetical protein